MHTTRIYVTERKRQRGRCLSATGEKVGDFIDKPPDMPEFLLHIVDARRT